MAKRPEASAKSRNLKLVSVEVDPELWQAFREKALKERTTASALVREFLAWKLGKVERLKR